MPFPMLNWQAQFIETPRSSNVLGIGYDHRRETLRVWFVSGEVYEYYRRAWSVWRDFRAAQSKGRFVHQYLTPGGNYRRVW
jgi:hypothetical protein